MINHILIYSGAFFTFIWGIVHLFPTRSVVDQFGVISQDNKQIITMEWIIEGLSLIFIGLIVAVVTMIDRSSTVSSVVYWIAFAELNALSVVSLLTGFQVDFLPFKMCPAVFTGSSILIVLGNLL